MASDAFAQINASAGLMMFSYCPCLANAPAGDVISVAVNSSLTKYEGHFSLENIVKKSWIRVLRYNVGNDRQFIGFGEALSLLLDFINHVVGYRILDCYIKAEGLA